MDVMRLDPTTFLADDLVEGYSSMIWTERYSTASGFQMKTPKIQDTLTRIPDGSLIALRDSKEVMLVESTAPTENEQGGQELTVTGRSLTSFLEKRFLVGDYQIPWAMQREYTVQEAIAIYIWNSIVNDTGVDVTRSGSVYRESLDAIPNVIVTESSIVIDAISILDPPDLSDLQTTQEWWLESGELYSRILNMLDTGKLGLRCVRPEQQPLSTENIVSFDSDGYIYRDGADVSELRFDIYNGMNRTETPSLYNPQVPVIFREDAGHLEDPKYLFSRQNYRNVAHISSPLGELDLLSNPDQPSPSGLNRYGLYVDGGQIDTSLIADYDVAILQKGREALKQNSRIALVDGAISTAAPYRYDSDYFLGDSVVVIGEYGIKQDMVVTEYVRTEDFDGERGYPTLVIKE